MFSTPSAAYTAVAVLVLATCYSPVLATPGKAVTQLEGYTFERYVSEFGKDYGNNEEWEARREIFLKRLNAATVHNTRAQQSYFRGINHLSDRTEEELKEIKGLDRSLLHFQVQTRLAGRQRDDVTTALDVSELPDSVDWRDRGIITPVKNQGQCGSCWTFASTETLESQWALKTGNLEELSEQFILDCTPNPHECGGTGGCFGGTAELAYERLVETGGIPSEWTYPYVSGTGNSSTCHGLPLPPAQPHHGGVSAVAKITGYRSTKTNSYADMLHTLATKGPLAVSVATDGWHDYSGGVFNGGNHTNPVLDHLVQLIGYGTDKDTGQDFWLIRNSWTPLWGENGTIRLLREEDPSCGIDLNPLDGNGCKGGPKQVQVCGQSGVLYDGVYPTV